MSKQDIVNQHISEQDVNFWRNRALCAEKALQDYKVKTYHQGLWIEMTLNTGYVDTTPLTKLANLQNIPIPYLFRNPEQIIQAKVSEMFKAMQHELERVRVNL